MSGYPKTTILAAPGWTLKAGQLADRFRRELPELGPRPRLRDCVLYVVEGEVAFAVWGGPNHVRVRQGDPT